MSKNFEIVRYETKGDTTYMMIKSTVTPNYIEHFFTPNELLNLQDTVTGLVADLSLMDDDYIPPTPIISKLSDLKNFTVDVSVFATRKAAKKALRLAKKNDLNPPKKQKP